ncbi:MAG TPA: receptor, partial [Algoriphagus sp.]|nr:receptor [Algoriphagus sp.]
PKIFTKRCGKCGHLESSTAGTVFHGIRIPLEKAFFLSYLVLSGQNNYTLEQISEFLDLRVNAISSFKIKIKSVLSESQNSHPDWEDLLLDQSSKMKENAISD